MTLPKVLAIYLPQFHRTPDNDRWWGDGFTDWETVKTAESYFEGHSQPRIPLEKDYYDLLEKKTMQKQAKLAKYYGVDGFCFYHYYFKNGKLELEKPAENLLRWKDIDMPFCFNWASEPWIRSWSRIPGNVWAEKYDSSGETDKSGVLVAQDYGSEEEWEKHFYYLLPFFKDDRYIRIEGKPVFVFYSPDDIRCLGSMADCWRELARKEGFEDLYLIGSRMTGLNDCLDAALIYEPRHAINGLNEAGKIRVEDGVRCLGYNDVWEQCLESKGIRGMKTFFSAVVDYDDTPRRGRSGECFTEVSPEIFRDGLEKLLHKSAAKGNELMFINAWNEWGEGMYLEPDSEREYGMLEALKEAKSNLRHKDYVKQTTDEDSSQPIQDEQAIRNAKKFKELFEIIDRWLFLEQENEFSLKGFLDKNGFNSFAIYGMASIGKHLLIQARKEEIEPSFGIDRYVGQFGDDFKIYRPEEEIPKVDCIIVTAYDYDGITKSLRKKVDSHIFYIGDVLSAMQF